MRKYFFLGLVIFFGLALTSVPPIPAQQAQPATAVQQTATKLDAAAICGTSATTSGTIVFTPPGSQYFYLTEIDFENMASSSAVTAAAPTTVSISNISGLPLWSMASGTTAGTNTQSFSNSYPTALKSITAGSAVTVTLPAFATNQVIRVNACGYFGY